MNIHELKHNYGARLKDAGVSKDHRSDLLGQKNRHVTNLYVQRNLLGCLKTLTK
jgi:hypothetical protein